MSSLKIVVVFSQTWLQVARLLLYRCRLFFKL